VKLAQSEAKQRQAAVATAGDEMQVLKSIAAAQSFGHGKVAEKPRPSKSRRAGHPQTQNREHVYGILTPQDVWK
jgi:hypothetical protein